MIKNGKIFGKINIFDFIVLVLLLLMAFGFFAFTGIDAVKDIELKKEDYLKEVNYEIKLESVRMETVDCFEAGTPIYDADRKIQIGIVTSAEAEQAHTIMETFNGKAVKAPIEGKYDLTLKIRAIAYETPEGELWITQTERLLEGRVFTFITQKNRCQGNVKNVEITDDMGLLITTFTSQQEKYYKKNSKKNK